jgi:hypothetical protein
MEGEFDWENELEQSREQEIAPSETGSGFGCADIGTTSLIAEIPYNAVEGESTPAVQISSSDMQLSKSWSSLLDTVQTMALPKRSLLQPWERGFAALVFGSSSSSTSNPVRLPFVPIPDPIVPNKAATEPQL